MQKSKITIFMTIALLIMAGVVIYKESNSKPTPLKTTTTTKTTTTQNTNQPTQGETETMQEATTTKKYSAQPEMQIDQSKLYTATLKTSEGDITIELNAAQTPITANNFVALAKDGFYDGTIFHRIIKGFMIQGGDPEGTGRGGPGYKFADEKFEGSYNRGVVAMANAGPNTNGSQFFIMHQDYSLPKNYVIFGHVVEGIEIVDKIANAPVKPSMSGENSTPVKAVTVESVKIEEK